MKTTVNLKGAIGRYNAVVEELQICRSRPLNADFAKLVHTFERVQTMCKALSQITDAISAVGTGGSDIVDKVFCT